MLKTEVKLELELSCVRNFLLSDKVEEPDQRSVQLIHQGQKIEKFGLQWK